MRNMATASSAAAFSCWRCIFLFFVGLLGLSRNVLCYVPEIEVTCRSMVDLKANNYDAGLVVSQLPPSIPIYANEDERCDIYLSIPTGHEMMFYFDWLDLYSGNRLSCDTANIELFDGSAREPVKGLAKTICGDEEEMPTGVYFVYNNFLIIRVNALGAIQGTGFKIHFTIYRRAFPCSREEFACETFGSRRCIANSLVCDDWNDCGDWMDEQQDCNNITAGGIAAIVLVCIGLIVLIVGLIIFCKIRRQREIKMISEKEAAVMRDNSISSRGGFVSPMSISNETLERDKYIPRYNTGRNSGRRSQTPTRAPYYEERPPPYTEKPQRDDSYSEDGLYEDQEPRSHRRSQNRDSPDPSDVFDDEEIPRVRRGRTRSQDRAPSRADDPPRDDRHPSKRDSRDPRDQGSRYPPREAGRYNYPSRRDEQDSPRSQDRYSRDKDREDRSPSRDDRYNPPRHDTDREKDRRRGQPDDRERDRDSRRERPKSRQEPPVDPYRSGEDDMMDQLHPLRENKRLSRYSDSDPDVSRESRKTPPRDRSYDDDRRREPQNDRHPRDRNSRTPNRDDPRYDFPDRQREPPSSRSDPRNPDDSYDSGQDRPPKNHRNYHDSPPPPGDDPEDSPPRRRRRRSRSRDDPDRSRSSRHNGDDREDDRRGRHRPSVPPDDEPRRARLSHGGYKEESV